MKDDAYDILVVDNGSRDGSVDYLRETFSTVQVIANGRNLGFAAACNIGMERALRGDYEYVLLVNNDTVVHPNLLTELRAEAERCTKLGMASPKIYFFEPSDRIWWAGGTYNKWIGIPAHVGRKRIDSCQFDKNQTIDWATGCVLLLRCDVLRETGLFDEQIFGNGEDLDLSLRMRKLGYIVRYTPAAKVWHREGIDYRKNVGEYVRAFTLARNLLWIMHKHAKVYQWLTFWPIFTGYYLPKMTVLFAARGDLRSSWALWQGVAAFWKMLLNPGSSVLPYVLGATMHRIGAAENIKSSMLPPD